MDEIVKKIAALGVPGLILVVLMATSGFAGGAALTVALATLGPFGMVSGIAMLGIIGLISQAFASYGIENVIKASIRENLKTKSRERLKMEVNSYPISKSLKLKLIDYIDKTN